MQAQRINQIDRSLLTQLTGIVKDEWKQDWTLLVKLEVCPWGIRSALWMLY